MEHHRVVATIDAHQSSIVCITWHPNGHEFASASEDLTIRIWEVDHSIR
jgi:WD40 repeat protein